MEIVVISDPVALQLRQNPGTHWVGGCMHPIIGLDIFDNIISIVSTKIWTQKSFPKILAPPSNSWCQKDDMKQVP